MLSYAEKYKTTETNYPVYLTNTYEKANPAKMSKSLQSKGFIEAGSAKCGAPLSRSLAPPVRTIAPFLMAAFQCARCSRDSATKFYLVRS